MKKLTAIIGICLIAVFTQAQTTTTADSKSATSTGIKSHSEKSHKQFNPEEILAKINEALSKRQTQAQKATDNGRTDIAGAIQKIITDLNNMKTAMNNKDRAAFKAANEQRKQDREALQSLRKTGGQKNKHSKDSGSAAPASSAKL